MNSRTRICRWLSIGLAAAAAVAIAVGLLTGGGRSDVEGAAEDLGEKLERRLSLLDQYMAAEFLTSGALDRNLQKTIGLYRHRRDKMLVLLEKYMPAGVSWTHPEGGLFLWLTLPESIDTVALYDEALSAGVAYVAGSFFYTDGSHRNTMRLNYSFVDEAKMEPGVKLLASLLAQHAD